MRTYKIVNSKNWRRVNKPEYNDVQFSFALMVQIEVGMGRGEPS